MYKYTFTVFTPTYNRAHTIRRVYDSLVKQTFKDFEWLVIDDGSTDDTESLIQSLDEGKITIRYIKKENEHKYVTMLKGIDMARGMFFLPLDSDDECASDTLEDMYKAYQEIPETEKSQFTGICGLCIDQYGNIVGDKYPKSPFISNDVDNIFKYKIKGEKWGFHKTSILKELILDDSLRSSGYIMEGLIWYQISLAGYKTKYINKAWRTYYVDEAHDAITKKGASYTKDAKGRMTMYLFIYNHLLKYFIYNPIEFTKMGISYIANSHILGLGFGKQIDAIKSVFGKLIYLSLYPVGWIYYKFKMTD